METFNLQRVVERTYQLGSFTWSGTDGSNAELARYRFPQSLFDNPQVAAIVFSYRYFRAKVRIEVRVTSNAFSYGVLTCAYTPNGFSDDRVSTLSQRLVSTGYPHVLISASNPEAVTMDIPFIYHHRFLDLEDFYANAIAEVVIGVAQPLRNINGESTPVNVTVTASFVDVELSLPRVFAQSASVNMEAINKSAQGIVSSTLDSFHDIAAQISNVMPSNELKILKHSVKAASTVSKMFGLNKPLTLARTNIMTSNPYSDLNTMDGINTAMSLGSTVESKVSSVPINSSCDSDEMKLSVLASTPTAHHFRHINDLTLREIGLLGPEVNTTIYDYVSRMFVYRTGGVKFKFYFFAPPALKMRCVIFLSSTTGVYDYTTTYHKYVDIEGDTTVEFTIPYISNKYVMDITSMRVMLQPLYISNCFSTVGEGPYMIGYKAGAPDTQFYCPRDLVTTPQCNPRFDFAKDFDMFHSSMQGYSQQDLVVGEDIHSIRELIHREVPTTWGDNTIRFIPAFVPTGSFKAMSITADIDYTDIQAGPEVWSNFYRFFRGSTCFRVVRRNPQASSAPPMADSMTIFYGKTDEEYSVIQSNAISTTDGTTTNTKVMLPFYSQDAYYSTNPPQTDTNLRPNYGLVIRPSYLTSANYYIEKYIVYKSCGDDFNFSFIVKPPTLTTTTSNTLTTFNTPCAFALQFFGMGTSNPAPP